MFRALHTAGSGISLLDRPARGVYRPSIPKTGIRQTGGANRAARETAL
jgi:hypothetical protein